MGKKWRTSFRRSQKVIGMKSLLEFLIKNITGSDEFSIDESAQEENRINFEVKANKEIIGLIIGRDGKTIKNIRKILSIPATLSRQSVNISVIEK